MNAKKKINSARRLIASIACLFLAQTIFSKPAEASIIWFWGPIIEANQHHQPVPDFIAVFLVGGGVLVGGTGLGFIAAGIWETAGFLTPWGISLSAAGLGIVVLDENKESSRVEAGLAKLFPDLDRDSIRNLEYETLQAIGTPVPGGNRVSLEEIKIKDALGASGLAESDPARFQAILDALH